MKKTFISPVATILATEAQQVIAASSFDAPTENISAEGSGTGQKVVGDARRGTTVNGAPSINVEALDF